MADRTAGIDGVVLRAARRYDLDALRSIARRTWDGRDFLGDVAEDWIDEPTGEFIVAERAGAVVGTIKVTRLESGWWWLEACRVDPDARERGLGSTLVRHGVVRAGELAAAEGGAGVMGGILDESNVPSLRIFSAAGFQETVRLTRCVATCGASTANGEQFDRLTASDVERAVEFIGRCGSLPVACGMQQHRPVAVPLDDGYVSKLIEAGRVYGWTGVRHDRDRLDGLVVVDDTSVRPSGDRELSISYLDAPGELVALAGAVRSLGATLGASTVEHQLQADPSRVASMLRARWRRPAGLNMSVVVSLDIGAERAP